MHRNKHIDNTKGIGIALVVLGHNWLTWHEKGELFNIIFSFHMPLFILISGLYINPNTTLNTTIAKRAASLLKPYFLISSILLLPKIYAAAIAKDLSPILYKAEAILWANGDVIPWSPMWFLPHIFLATSIATATIKHEKSKWIEATGLLLLIGLGYFYIQPTNTELAKSETGINSLFASGLPWSAELLLISVPLVILGYRIRSSAEEINIQPIYFLLTLLIFVSLHIAYNESLDLNRRELGNFPITTLQAASGIYLTLIIAKIATANNLATQILSTIGKHSLFILIFHTPIQSKSFDLLTHTGLPNETAAWISLSLGIGAPILIARTTKKNKTLAKLLLPSQR